MSAPQVLTVWVCERCSHAVVAGQALWCVECGRLPMLPRCYVLAEVGA